MLKKGSSFYEGGSVNSKKLRNIEDEYEAHKRYAPVLYLRRPDTAFKHKSKNAEPIVMYRTEYSYINIC